MADASAKTNDDIFADTFALLSDEKPVAIIDPKADPVADEADAAAAERAAGAVIEHEGSLPDPSKVGADGTVEGDKPAEEKPAPKAEEKPAAKVDEPGNMDDLLRRLHAIAKEAPAPAPAEAAKPAIPELTQAQQDAVSTYMREFPDVYQAEQIIRRQEYRALTDFIFDAIRPYITGLSAQTTSLAEQAHADALATAVPDYDEVVPKVQAWIGEQPAYLKAAYEAVAAKGSVQDVVDLIGRWRSASGTAAPAAAAAAVAEPPKPPTTTGRQVAQVVKGLAPVGSKRSGVATEGVSKDDFDGAFKLFAEQAA